jgi:hypothetical protein
MTANNPLVGRDRRVVFGANCSWWDTIDKVGTKESGLPCCPYCGSALFEYPDIEGWYIHAKRFEDGTPFPNYVALLRWMQGKCFSNLDAAHAAYMNRGDDEQA